MRTITATFEDGVLKPSEPLDLPPRAEVKITIELVRPAPLTVGELNAFLRSLPLLGDDAPSFAEDVRAIRGHSRRRQSRGINGRHERLYPLRKKWKARRPVTVASLGTGVHQRLTVSELLMGVHRANSEARRQRRSAFVEAIIVGVAVLDFTVATARVHAEIYSHLAARGQSIGAHDLIIAATARHHDLPILTDNAAEFSRVPGLRVVSFVS